MKNKTLIVVLTVFLLLMFSQPGVAQSEPEIKTFAIGARVSYIDFANDEASGVKIDFDETVIYGINFSYFFTDRYSMELSIEHTEPETDIDPGTSYNLGETSQTPVMLTGKIHFPTETPIVPYLGAGFGYFFNSFDLASTSRTITAVDVDNSFGVHINGGFEFFLTDSATFGFDVKYILNNADFAVTRSNSTTTEYDFDMDKFVLGFGVKYYFK